MRTTDLPGSHGAERQIAIDEALHQTNSSDRTAKRRIFCNRSGEFVSKVMDASDTPGPETAKHECPALSPYRLPLGPAAPVSLNPQIVSSRTLTNQREAWHRARWMRAPRVVVADWDGEEKCGAHISCKLCCHRGSRLRRLHKNKSNAATEIRPPWKICDANGLASFYQLLPMKTTWPLPLGA